MTLLNIILCTKMQEYMEKGYLSFGALSLAKEVEDKSEKKRLEDVPIVRDFPEVFPEDLPGLPRLRQVEFQIYVYLCCNMYTGTLFRLCAFRNERVIWQLKSCQTRFYTYHPDKVYHLKKALYGLKQAPRAWYDEFPNFLVSKGFSKHGMTSCDSIGTPMATKHLNVDLSGGDKFVSWSSKKQDCTSMSSAEVEYVSLSTCCVQVLWLRTQLTDYGFHFDKIPMYCDSKVAIAISCNPVRHSLTKHIDVRYHFIKEQVEKDIVELFFVRIEYQLADLFTKALSEDRFKYLVRRLGMRCLTLDELEVLAIEST
ncbi:retrovirus-related pol polyprotein from transposon TNT 1-94 [Tanacetum coccineum]